MHQMQIFSCCMPDLVLDEDASKARRCKAAHGALHTERIAVAGVAIANDGNGPGGLVDGSAWRLVLRRGGSGQTHAPHVHGAVPALVQDLAVGQEVRIRRAEPGSCDSKAAHEGHLEPGVLNELGRETVVRRGSLASGHWEASCPCRVPVACQVHHMTHQTSLLSANSRW